MERIAEKKKCPRCGAEFECFSEADCWCENYQIHRKDYLKIIQSYDDCLCPSCLKNYSEQ